MRPTAPANTAKTSPANDASNLAGRTGIQSVEVGFTLLSVLAKSPKAMMLRDLAHVADMSPESPPLPGQLSAAGPGVARPLEQPL